MPTDRARIMLTATPEIERALEVAAARWPEERERPSRLLLKLVEEGRRAVETEQDAALERRRAVIRRVAGSMTGVYGPGYLEELRADWPE